MSLFTNDVEATQPARQQTSTAVFPEGFLWGAATSAFQVEGASTVDGRGESIWDAFCRVPGAIADGSDGTRATDHYHRLRQDVQLMADLGLTAYRFSIAWPRVRPGGGAVNQVGLDFYRRLVDELLEHGITPWPTLYHWDLPQELEDQGGWANRDTAHRFAEYVDVVCRALGDRLRTWTTLNEPWCSAFLGYAGGIHAPGRTEPKAAVAAAHHLLLGHGLAVAAIRAAVPDAAVGISLNLFPTEPVNPQDDADVEAARRVDGLQNRIFLDPLLRGEYPADLVADLEPYGLAEHIAADDLKTIGAPLDLLGVNYYTTHRVSGHPDESAAKDRAGTEGGHRTASPWVGAEHVSFHGYGLPQTAMGWEVNPEGLTRLLLRLHQEYPRLPLYITENGAAYPDVVTEDGTVQDPERVAYLDSHLRAAHAAIQAGVDLRGYFCWSLMDNFEWAEGYAKRFGLVYVDYETMTRIPKMSATWYSQVARGNALPDAENR